MHSNSYYINLLNKGKLEDIEEDIGGGKIGTSSMQRLAIALKKGKEKIASIFMGIFRVATLVSNFDIKLAYYEKRISDISEKMNVISARINASTQEISAGTNQIVNSNAALSDSINQIAMQSSSLADNTQKSNQLLDEIKNETTGMKIQSDKMKSDISRLAGAVDKVKSTVRIIEDISMQTSILGINASIESARAGEAGKGFAVVARDIKELADTTSSLLQQVNSMMAEIDVATDASLKSVNITADSVKKVDEGIIEIYDILKTNSQSVDSIAEYMTTIAANSEEVNASLEETAAAMESISNESHTTLVIAEDLVLISGKLNEISHSIGAVEKEVDELAASSGQMANSGLYGLSNSDFIKSVSGAITAHQGWVKTLKEMGDSMEIQPIQTDDHKCGFGHFYYSVKPSEKEILKLWNEVEAHHHVLHTKGHEVMHEIEAENVEKVKTLCTEAENISITIIGLFNQMVKMANDMDKKGQKVF